MMCTVACVMWISSLPFMVLIGLGSIEYFMAGKTMTLEEMLVARSKLPALLGDFYGNEEQWITLYRNASMFRGAFNFIFGMLSPVIYIMILGSYIVQNESRHMSIIILFPLLILLIYFSTIGLHFRQ